MHCRTSTVTQLSKLPTATDTTAPSTTHAILLKESASARVFGSIPVMNEEAMFTQAYDEHVDALFAHCCFRIASRERARDLTQEAFMKTWDAIRSGTEIRNHKAFLFRVLNNLIIDEYRKKKSTSLDALLEQEEVNEGHFEDLRDGGLEEELEKLEVALQSEKLKAALDELPDPYKTAVTLRFMEDLRPKEMAEILGESENVVSVRINRGVKRLRDLMESV